MSAKEGRKATGPNLLIALATFEVRLVVSNIVLNIVRTMVRSFERFWVWLTTAEFTRVLLHLVASQTFLVSFFP